jgi:hypothetical protein
MAIKQLSLFIESKPGRLADITERLANENIEIKAISIADTSDFGIVRLIVDNPDEADDILEKDGLTVSVTSVLAVGIRNSSTSEIARAVRYLADERLSVEYIYSCVGKKKGEIYLILRVDDCDKATELLRDKKIHVLTESELLNI